MNTKQLWFALSTNKITNNYFDGIFPKDTLNNIVNKPSLIICNTDNSYEPGEHWILFFFENDICEFYDSLGKDVLSYGETFYKFAQKFATKINQAEVRTQPIDTPYCGELCLFFAYMRCKGYCMGQILEALLKPYAAIEFVKKKFNICHKSSCISLQCCKCK